MEFRTSIPIEDGKVKIHHDTGVFLLGSCFVENIGEKLDWFKINNLQNPLGILFHPAPMERFLSRLAKNRRYTEADVFEFNEVWQSFDGHSDMAKPDKDECINGLNASFEKTREYLKNAAHVVISLGTAWGYRAKEKSEIVANCHKIPQKEFVKVLWGEDQIQADLRSMISSIKSLNSSISIIFTISPVRHFKDGVINNQRSKAHLIAALHKVLEENKSAGIEYFPSYEIVMDELRDYRFYKEDMLHPNALAVKYIWEQFSQNWLSNETMELNKKIDKIQRSISHRPRAEFSHDHKKFLTGLQLKIEEIQKKHPKITFPEATSILRLLNF